MLKNQNFNMWKIIRISVLLIILLSVVQQVMQENADLNWQKTFYVVVYPINADADNAANNVKVNTYISTLNNLSFEAVNAYFSSQGQHYQLTLRRPIEVSIGPSIKEIPPAPPQNANVMQIMFWSLKFRYYAWRNNPKMAIKPDIKLYLLYHEPNLHPVLSHSTALSKGRIGRVNLFADPTYAQKNLVILAHELLHTVRASDKYDSTNHLPINPDGFAEPVKQPTFPQKYAELMAGRVPISQNHAIIPFNLDATVIGEKTAREIGWVR